MDSDSYRNSSIRLDTGPYSEEVPEPEYCAAMVVNQHWSYEGYDWVRIALAMPYDTYEIFAAEAGKQGVTPSELMYDLVKLPGERKDISGYHTGLSVDFTGEPTKEPEDPE